jgi:hypothetical protein
MIEQVFTELFRTKSFDNIWYWLMLSVAWSVTTQWTLGVGNHDARAAMDKGGKYMSDFETLVRIYCDRMHENAKRYGSQAMFGFCFVLASLATLGFWFWILFAQAMFFLVFPFCVTTLISVMYAHRQVEDPRTGKDLVKRYRKLRLLKQTIGVFTITTTSFWGTIVIFRMPVL